MVAAHRSMAGRDHASLDWRALVVVVLFHAALVGFFLSSRWSEPVRSSLAQLVLVELWEPHTADRKPEAVSATITAAAQHAANHAREKIAAQPKDRSHAQPDRRIVVPEGREAVSVSPELPSAAISTAAAASVAGVGSTASLATRGNGSYAGPRFRPPRVQRRVTPDYPIDAYKAHLQGTVDVMVSVSTDGRPLEAHVYQSSGTTSLDAAAVKAVLAYTYKPAERNGSPIEAQAIVTIDWQIGPNTVEHVEIASPKPTTPDREAVMKQLDCLGDPEMLRHVELCKRRNQ